MQPKVSVFKSVDPKSFVGDYAVNTMVEGIQTMFKPETDHLRTLTDVEEAKIYKAGKCDKEGRLIEPGKFKCVTWSGTFKGGKKTENLCDHSGLICMDVDGLTPDQVATLNELLREDGLTHVLFISPSGKGVKWVVKIDIQHPDEHKAFFRQLSDYLHESYGLTRKGDVPKGDKPQIDPSGCNVDRLCFLAHDPTAFYNPDSDLVPLVEEYRTPPKPEPQPAHTPPANSIPVNVEDDTHQRLTDCINRLQASGIDLTADRADWIKIGFAFASMGEQGRTYYHEVSRFYPKYDYTETDAKFSELLRNGNGQVNIGSFFHHVEQVLGKVWKEPITTGSGNGNGRNAPPNKPPSDAPDVDPPPVSKEWHEPQPLTAGLLSVLSVTPPMIPEPLRPWLTDIAHRMKCPLDFVAAPAIVMLSSIIGTRLTIKPKTRDSWTVVPNLWGAVIGGPSTMKSPSISEVLKPLNRMVVAARAEFDEAMAHYEKAVVDYEVQKKVYAKQEQDRHGGKNVETTVSYPETPEKPKERRFMVNDTTVEKLADLLNENPTGLLQMRDELTGLLASWDRAGHEQDRAFHLEAWNGNGAMTVDRMGRGTTHVNVLCESLFGGIQPAKLQPYLQAATGYENDGFVQRLQVAVFPDSVKWEYGDDYPDKAARDRAFDLIQKIAVSDFKTIGYDTEEHERFPYTYFNPDAQGVFKQWLTEWETNVLPNESGLLLEHFTKYRSLMPSLALIFHVVNCTDRSEPLPTGATKQYVSLEAARMAVLWCEYLMSHARRIYGLLDTASIESARELVRHLKQGDLKDGFKVRDVYRKGWTRLGTTEQAEAAVSELVTRHYLMEVQPLPTKGGRPEDAHYLINPKIKSNT